MGVCIWVYEKERDRLKQRDNAKQRKYDRQKLTNMKRENNTFIRYFKNVFLLDLKIFTFLKCKFFIISSPQCLVLYIYFFLLASYLFLCFGCNQGHAGWSLPPLARDQIQASTVETPNPNHYATRNSLKISFWVLLIFMLASLPKMTVYIFFLD